MMDDFYKTCRWCHWFKNGKCLHGKTFRNSKSETDIVYLAEEGVISEAIKEGFTEKAFSNLKSNLESSLSKKKRQKSLNRKNFVANILCKAVIGIVLQRFC